MALNTKMTMSDSERHSSPLQGCLLRLLTFNTLQCTGNVVFKAMDR